MNAQAARFGAAVLLQTASHEPDDSGRVDGDFAAQNLSSDGERQCDQILLGLAAQAGLESRDLQGAASERGDRLAILRGGLFNSGAFALFVAMTERLALDRFDVVGFAGVVRGVEQGGRAVAFNGWTAVLRPDASRRDPLDAVGRRRDCGFGSR